jgi:3-phosphoshikimate 1-carboxyvinyltransferase
MTIATSATFEPCGPISASIRPPGSKSLTNRAIVCAALAEGKSRLQGVLDSEDTQVMVAAWRQLGLELTHDRETQTLGVVGCGGKILKPEADLYVANSGTTIRFLCAALSACGGNYRLHGVERMHSRPIGDLVTALEVLGATVHRLNSEHADCPPIRVESAGLHGGEVAVKGNISSQFLSGLMMAAPLCKEDTDLMIAGELVSVPYVEMTSSVMKSFGARVESELPRRLKVESTGYRGTEYAIEPDASAASYFWATAAICGGVAKVEGLTKSCLQGDVGFCRVLEQMGCTVKYLDDAIEVQRGETLRGVDVNMADISDTVQTLAAVAMFAEGATKVTGIAHNRVKETDRISDLATELRKLGAQVEEFEDGFNLTPPDKVRSAEIDTYSDHRMAMSLSLVGLRQPGIKILDPGCTAKTYPEFWGEMSAFVDSRIRWGD